ncbi:MAG TPA: hypothetical protein VK619_12300 [Pyrinomonadaceae bacterium]|nr:hypothetical protein [Pyrinomonadaceae bacterium]
MRTLERIALSFALPVLSALLIAGCTTADDNSQTTATTNVNSPAASPSPSPQKLSVVARPQKIADQQAQRGAEEEAKPVLKIVEPRAGATITGSTVNLRLDLSGNPLNGYHPHKNPDGKGNHIHVILDNQPYEAYYEIDQGPFELRNVTEGKHTIRVFASRPWHESYKNDGNFQMVTFTVKGGGDASRPTTTNSGQVMANNNAGTRSNTNATANTGGNANAAAQHEGHDMASSTAGEVDPRKPLLTYSRPKGAYTGDEADPIMIDFWLSNAKLQGNGGDYRVRYTIDNGEAQYIDTWAPIWLTGWVNGKHTIKLELVDKSGNVVDNGGYNSTTREITVTR